MTVRVSERRLEVGEVAPGHATRASRFAEAEAAYSEILARVPEHFVCLHHLGLIAHQRGEHSAAAQLIEQALTAKPDYVEALSNLGAIHRALGDTQAALAATRKRLPSPRNLHKPIQISAMPSKTRASSTQRSPPTGKPLRSIRVSSKLIRIRKLGQREEATAVCERIIKHRPDSAEPYFSLGNVLKELCRPDEAAKAYRRALALRPDFAEAYTNLVFCHKQLNPLCDGDSLRGWNTMNCDSCSSGRLASNYSG